jgi:hypothetical protein
MIHRLHRAGGYGAEDVLDLLAGCDVAPQYLDLQLLRGLSQPLEAGLGVSLVLGHHSQYALDLWCDFL